MRRVLFIFIIISFIASYVPDRIEAFPGAKITKAIGEGVLGLQKVQGKQSIGQEKGCIKLQNFLLKKRFGQLRQLLTK